METSFKSEERGDSVLRFWFIDLYDVSFSREDSQFGVAVLFPPWGEKLLCSSQENGCDVVSSDQ